MNTSNENEQNNVRMHERQALKTTSVGKTKTAETDGVCKNCGATVSADMEICPQCGHKLVDYCTFCGAPMSENDMDCPECGMPADGIMCQSCNVLNFRPFCRKCGQPLSRAARMAVEKAKKDPKVQETARLLKRMAELQAELDALGEEPLGEEGPQEPSEGELRLKALMAKVGFKPAEIPKPSAPKPQAEKRRSREEILAEYKQTIEDTNRILEEMLPPAGSTPQEQRNFYTARKVAVMDLVAKTWYGINPQDAMAWECNRCHVLHNNPSECIYKDLGGEWTDCLMWEIVPEGTKNAVKHVTYVEKKVYKR